ncbi:hypothetical protein HKD37_02G005093 [Glycine soja]
MQGKVSTNKLLFDPEISKTERKNKKKKKQATTKPLGESSSIDSPSPKKPLVIDSKAGRGEKGNRPPRMTLGDYAYQQGPKHYNNIVIPPFNNKVVELKPTLLSLIGSHPFVGMDHEDPYTHLSTFMELCNTMGAFDKDVEAVYLRVFPFSLIGTMTSKSLEEAIVIIDSIAASDYQSHHDRAQILRKGPSNNSYANSSNKGPQQPQAQPDRMSKMEDTLTQFIQVFVSNKKNIDASIKNMKVQVGQLAKQLSEHESRSFSANTHVNLKEECKVITTRRGTMVGLKDDDAWQQHDPMQELLGSLKSLLAS